MRVCTVTTDWCQDPTWKPARWPHNPPDRAGETGASVGGSGDVRLSGCSQLCQVSLAVSSLPRPGTCTFGSSASSMFHHGPDLGLGLAPSSALPYCAFRVPASLLISGAVMLYSKAVHLLLVLQILISAFNQDSSASAWLLPLLTV